MRPTILIIEDFDETAELLRVGLGQAGYRVVTAATGQQALDAASTEDPRLILVDLYMPGLSGFETARALRQRDSLLGVPLVAMTAYGGLGIEEQLRAQATSAGFDEYITKPFEMSEIVALVGRLISRP